MKKTKKGSGKTGNPPAKKVKTGAKKGFAH